MTTAPTNVLRLLALAIADAERMHAVEAEVELTAADGSVWLYRATDHLPAPAWSQPTDARPC